MEIWKKLLLLVVISEGKSSLNTIVWIKNWMKIVEASIVTEVEEYIKKDTAQVGDSVITAPAKLANFESKALIGRGEVDFADEWNQLLEKLKSRAVQIEVGKILVDVSCQVEDLVVSVDNEILSSENCDRFSSTNACNEVTIIQEDAEAKFLTSFHQSFDLEDAKEMKDNSVVDGSFTLRTLGQTERILENGNLRSGNRKSSLVSMETKHNDEFTGSISQREIYRTQFADYLNEVDVKINLKSQEGATSSLVDLDEMVRCAETVIPMGNRNCISERLRSAFKTIRLVS